MNLYVKELKLSKVFRIQITKLYEKYSQQFDAYSLILPQSLRTSVAINLVTATNDKHMRPIGLLSKPVDTARTI